MTMGPRTVDAIGLDADELADELAELVRCANEETTSAQLEVEALRGELGRTKTRLKSERADYWRLLDTSDKLVELLKLKVRSLQEREP